MSNSMLNNLLLSNILLNNEILDFKMCEVSELAPFFLKSFLIYFFFVSILTFIGMSKHTMVCHSNRLIYVVSDFCN